ncbi:MAG: hypothetical protein M5U26_17900 [Planctomycetota bacterium]|nr:hypothetical protein [Planctomycetota bacterium]
MDVSSRDKAWGGWTRPLLALARDLPLAALLAAGVLGALHAGRAAGVEALASTPPEAVALFGLLAWALLVILQAGQRLFRFVRGTGAERPKRWRAALLAPFALPILLLLSILDRLPALLLLLAWAFLGVGLATLPDLPPLPVTWPSLLLLFASGCGMLALGVQGLRGAAWLRRRDEELARLTRCDIKDLKPGLALLEGRVALSANDPDHLKDAPVAWRRDPGHPASDKCEDFLLEDGTGVARIEPGADLPLEAVALDPRPEGARELRPGDEIWVLGEAQPLRGSEGAAARVAWELRPLRAGLSAPWKPGKPGAYEAPDRRFWRTRLLPGPLFGLAGRSRRDALERLCRGWKMRAALAVCCLGAGLAAAAFAARTARRDWIEVQRPLDSGVEDLRASLAAGLESDYARARIRAAKALCRDEERASALRSQLVKALADPNREVRHRAAHALAPLADPEAIGALLATGARHEPCLWIGDLNRPVRYAALDALGRMPQEALAPWQERGSFEERVLALEALVREHEAAAERLSAPLVAELLGRTASREAWLAGLALERFEVLDRDRLFAPVVARLIREGGPQDVEAAFVYYAPGFDPPPADLVRAAGDCIGRGDARMRWRALNQLGRWGAAAAPALPEIVRCLHDATPETALAAMHVLQHIGPDAAEAAVPVLIEVLASPRYSMHDPAERTLLRMGAKARGKLELARTNAAPEVRPRLEQVLLQLRDPVANAQASNAPIVKGPLEAEPEPAEAPRVYDLQLNFLFDNRPITEFTPARPHSLQFQALLKTHLNPEPAFDGHRVTWSGLEPGEYRVTAFYKLHDGPESGIAGDFMGWETFAIKPGEHKAFDFHLKRAIRLLEPADTAGALENVTTVAGKIRFAWAPVAEGAEYELHVRTNNGWPAYKPKTKETALELDLEPNHYLVSLSARKDNREIGQFRCLYNMNHPQVPRRVLYSLPFTALPVEGEPGNIEGALLHDGKPLAEATALAPRFTLYDVLKGRELNLPVTLLEGSRYRIEGLPVGRYSLRVAVDAEPDTPEHAAGDFGCVIGILVRSGARLTQDLALVRYLRLLKPEDGLKPVLAMSPPHPLPASVTSPVMLAWESLGPGLEYRYTLGGPQPRQGTTKEASIEVELTPGYYSFTVQAYREPHALVGELKVHGGGKANSLYSFKVVAP